MKKVLLVFLGLVLLSQVLKYWQRDHENASLSRPVPVKIHRSSPGNGHGGENSVRTMITGVEQTGDGANAIAGQT